MRFCSCVLIQKICNLLLSFFYPYKSELLSHTEQLQSHEQNKELSTMTKKGRVRTRLLLCEHT